MLSLLVVQEYINKKGKKPFIPMTVVKEGQSSELDNNLVG